MGIVRLKRHVRLTYYTHAPAGVAQGAVLLFLHGIGEAFVNLRPGEEAAPRAEIGHDRVLQQGPPKHLPRLAADHPLRADLLLVVPQLPDRETSWTDMAEEVGEITSRHGADEHGLYIVGFSKGGLGGFQLAKTLGARALVSIDGSPLAEDPREAADHTKRKVRGIPFWAIHTTYGVGESFRKIADFNELLSDHKHEGVGNRPEVGIQARTHHPAPAGMTPVERHVWVCDEVSVLETPYQWLLRH